MNRLIEDLVLRAARPYFAGTALEDAMRLAEEAGARGYPVTLCYWNAPDDPADKIADHYDAVIDAVSRAGIDAHMAIKVPPISEKPELIAEVLAKARAQGIAVDIRFPRAP